MKSLPAQMTGDNGKQQASFKKGNKVKYEARKRRVYVSPLLKKKIRQVIESPEYYGWFKQIQQHPIRQPADNDMVWFHLQPYTADAISAAFSPVDVLNAASILWNTKIPLTPNVTLTDADNFRYENFKVRVMESQQVTRFVNNTSHVLIIRIYDLSPKHATTAQTSGFGWDPIAFMAATLTDMSPQGAAGGADSVSNANPLSVAITTQGFTPTMLPAFKSMYSIDQSYVRLEPGKAYTHTLQGPKNLKYDYSKFIQSGVFVNQQKFNKHSIFSMTVELVGTQAHQAGRYVDLTPGTGYGLLLETTTFYKLAIPEQAGFVAPATAVTAGKSQYLGNKKNSFAIKHWTVAQAGTVVNVGDEAEAAIPGAGS